MLCTVWLWNLRVQIINIESKQIRDSRMSPMLGARKEQPKSKRPSRICIRREKKNNHTVANYVDNRYTYICVCLSGWGLIYFHFSIDLPLLFFNVNCSLISVKMSLDVSFCINMLECIYGYVNFFFHRLFSTTTSEYYCWLHSTDDPTWTLSQITCSALFEMAFRIKGINWLLFFYVKWNRISFMYCAK